MSDSIERRLTSLERAIGTVQCSQCEQSMDHWTVHWPEGGEITPESEPDHCPECGVEIANIVIEWPE